MIAQVVDSFRYKEKEYKFVSSSKPLRFWPQQYGITPKSRWADCWTGYRCEYEISSDGIILKNFYVNSENDNYPEINGVLPLGVDKNSKESFKYIGYHYYKGVNIKIPYTGKIVIGKDFLQKYYTHIGYQRPWFYKELKEIVFEDGVMVDEIDHSEVVEELRKQMKEDPDFWHKLYDNLPVLLV